MSPPRFDQLSGTAEEEKKKEREREGLKSQRVDIFLDFVFNPAKEIQPTFRKKCQHFNFYYDEVQCFASGDEQLKCVQDNPLARSPFSIIDLSTKTCWLLRPIEYFKRSALTEAAGRSCEALT